MNRLEYLTNRRERFDLVIQDVLKEPLADKQTQKTKAAQIKRLDLVIQDALKEPLEGKQIQKSNNYNIFNKPNPRPQPPDPIFDV
ncbi:MAG: hypothetical protein R6U52_00495 [Kosmotogaceae bacterium]